jgi:hypothetical protein
VAIPTGAGSEVPRAASTVAAVGQVAAAVVVVGVEMGAALAAGALVTLATGVAAVLATGVAAVLAAGGALLELPQAARATLRKRAAGASQRELLTDMGRLHPSRSHTGSAEAALIGGGPQRRKATPFLLDGGPARSRPWPRQSPRDVVCDEHPVPLGIATVWDLPRLFGSLGGDEPALIATR